jgi:Uma2 family endonuclease
VRIPDVCFTSFDRLPGNKASRESINPVAPDLAVEVLSESNTRREIEQKLKEFFSVLPGFQLSLKEIFNTY